MIRTAPEYDVVLPPVLRIQQVVEMVYEYFGYVAIITSGVDGEHSVGSLHYDADNHDGRALDYRTRNIPNAKRPAVADAISEALGDDFDVVLEATHLHVEYDK